MIFALVLKMPIFKENFGSKLIMDGSFKFYNSLLDSKVKV